MGFIAAIHGLFGRPIAFFLYEPVEEYRRLLQSRGIWCSMIDEVYPADGSTPGYVINVKPSQLEMALQILKEEGIL